MPSSYVEEYAICESSSLSEPKDDTKTECYESFPLLMILTAVLSTIFQSAAALVIQPSCKHFDEKSLESHENSSSSSVLHYCHLYDATVICVIVVSVMLIIFAFPAYRVWSQILKPNTLKCCQNQIWKFFYGILLIICLFIVFMQVSTTTISAIFSIFAALIHEACKTSYAAATNIIHSINRLGAFSIDLDVHDVNSLCRDAPSLRDSGIFGLKVCIVAFISQIIFFGLAFRKYGNTKYRTSIESNNDNCCE